MQAQVTDPIDIDVYQDLVTRVYDSMTRPERWSRSVIKLASAYQGKEPAEDLFYQDICDILGVPVSRKMFRFLLPHINKALSLCHRLEQVDQLQRASSEVLERLPYGVVLLSNEGLPLVSNAKARALCQAAESLCLSERGLDALDHEDALALKPAIDMAVTQGIGSALSVGQDKSLYLLFSPLPEDAFPQIPLFTSARVMVFISHPQGESSLAADAVKDIYGLSKAETRLVMELIKGYSIEEAARKLFVSKHTLRVQLRAVFKKTGARSQADLMRLLLAGPLTLREVI